MEALPVTPIEPPQFTENESFWKRHLKLQKNSGLCRAKYCRENNLDYDRFGYWLGKWKRQSSPSLVPVKLKPEVSIANQTVLCTLNFGKDRMLQIHDQQSLIFILERLG